MIGGASQVKEVSESAKKIVAEVQAAAEEQAGKKFEMFEPVSMKTQVVAGTNYFVKVKTSAAGEHIHLRIYKNLQQEVTLSAVQHPKTAEDALEYFEG